MEEEPDSSSWWREDYEKERWPSPLPKTWAPTTAEDESSGNAKNESGDATEPPPPAQPNLSPPVPVPPTPPLTHLPTHVEGNANGGSDTQHNEKIVTTPKASCGGQATVLVTKTKSRSGGVQQPQGSSTQSTGSGRTRRTRSELPFYCKCGQEFRYCASLSRHLQTARRNGVVGCGKPSPVERLEMILRASAEQDNGATAPIPHCSLLR